MGRQALGCSLWPLVSTHFPARFPKRVFRGQHGQPAHCRHPDGPTQPPSRPPSTAQVNRGCDYWRNQCQALGTSRAQSQVRCSLVTALSNKEPLCRAEIAPCVCLPSRGLRGEVTGKQGRAGWRAEPQLAKDLSRRSRGEPTHVSLSGKRARNRCSGSPEERPGKFKDSLMLYGHRRVALKVTSRHKVQTGIIFPKGQTDMKVSLTDINQQGTAISLLRLLKRDKRPWVALARGRATGNKVPAQHCVCLRVLATSQRTLEEQRTARRTVSNF